MSKSNCAFVNYRTKEACEAAVERFNHEVFSNGGGRVRLLCRLRRDTQLSRTRSGERGREGTNGHATPTDEVPSSASPRSSLPLECGTSIISASERSDSVLEDGDHAKEPSIDAIGRQIAGLSINDHTGHNNEIDTKDDHTPASSSPGTSPVQSDRYFVLKSLTKEDLNESLQKGTWETQPHNQVLLDSAFRETQRNGKNVYLIFSVNKSGEYFGFARMVGSPFDCVKQRRSEGSVDLNGSGVERFVNVEGLREIETPATLTAPRGKIVDDQARGTLFWEAKREKVGGTSLMKGCSKESQDGRRSEVPEDCGEEDDEEDDDDWRSRPFSIEWQSVRKVTFQRTKGMKNAWNSGKDVKVARDGTELESIVGKRMLELFFEDASNDTVDGASNSVSHGRR